MGGKEEENEGKTEFALFFAGIVFCLLYECSILVELVVCGGIAHFLVIHGGKR